MVLSVQSLGLGHTYQIDKTGQKKIMVKGSSNRMLPRFEEPI